jgi:hypothetical protein
MFSQILPASLALATVLYSSTTSGAITHLADRQLPVDPTGVQTLLTPSNVTIRYKQPGKEGICETTPGVNSYSGYIDLAPDAHTCMSSLQLSRDQRLQSPVFWFFESRNNPSTDPVTLWCKSKVTSIREAF